jgi:DNA-damage-inducible protein D
MSQGFDSIVRQLDASKKLTPKGGEYWMARDLQPILGYGSSWENFQNVINKARMACEGAGINPDDQFHDTMKKVPGGSGAMIPRGDCYLTRYGCYLIAMNGDTSKPEIGIAQTYFAIQARRQEIQDRLTAEERRILLRERVRSGVKNLLDAAKDAGVQKYGLFQDAGYRGLYDMGLTDIKGKKGIPAKEDLLDCAGRAELAMNEFRITQTEEKLRREGVNSERAAINTHLNVGREIRTTVARLGGEMPENLPAEENVKKIESRRKKELGGQKKELPEPPEEF